MPAKTKSKPVVGHRFERCRYMTQAVCECGWESAPWIGKGSRRNAFAEWRSHVAQCVATTAENSRRELT